MKAKDPVAAMKKIIPTAKAADAAGTAANRDSGSSVLSSAEYATGAMILAAESIIAAAESSDLAD